MMCQTDHCPFWQVGVAAIAICEDLAHNEICPCFDQSQTSTCHDTVTQIDPNHAPTDAAKLQEFQAAQGQLSNALSRLLVVSERYPELRATQNFQNLQAQLEGTENRISVERGNFNTAVQDYNVAVRTFPTNLFAGIFGFQPRPFFEAQAGAEKPPAVNFNFGSPAPASPAATAAATP